MKLTANQRTKFKLTRQISVAGILLALFFVYFADGTSKLYPFVTGAIAGLIGGLTLSVFELYLFSNKISNIKFIWLLTLKSVSYLVLFTGIIFNVVVISRMFRLDMTYIEILNTSDFHYYLSKGTFKLEVLYALFFSFIIIFTTMLNKKMGQGILMNYIKGKYFEPIHEARIILFINIENSNHMIDSLGALKFHKFLNKYFSDLTEPAIARGGIIYEYKEDLMIISWTMNHGLAEANCVNTFFDIQSTIENKRDEYLDEFGFEPRIQGGLHAGSLVTAEIGEIKTQIVFIGNTMNTASRILDTCHRLDIDLLASDQLLGMLGRIKKFKLSSIGKIKMKGKQVDLELFEIKDK